MHRFYSLLTLFYFLFFPFIGHSANETIPLEVLKGEPSAFVNGSVNVISGDYQEIDTDISVLGPLPLSYQRNYVSSHWGLGGLCYSWNINQFSQIEFLPVDKYSKSNTIDFYDYGGGVASFEGKFPKSSSKPIVHSISSRAIHRGITNTSSGEISGQTNIKNYRIEYIDKNNHHLVCKSGEGAIRKYRPRGYSPFAVFDIKEELLPNGQRIVYEYDFTRKHHSDYRLTKVQLFNKNNEKLHSLEVSYVENGKHAMYVKGSDGNFVGYHFTRRKGKYNDLWSEHLTAVKRHDGYEEYFEYSEERGYIGEQLTRKKMPQGRYLINEYYQESKGDCKCCPNPWLGRIKLQKAPVGVDETPIVTHRYEYTKKYNPSTNYFESGVTSVWDALNYQTDYHYSCNYRLTAIKTWTGEGNSIPYRTENFFWGGNHGANSTNLISRCTLDSNNTIHACRHYIYDNQGNVLEETLWGNLSGKKPESVIVDEDGNPKNTQSECLRITSTYSEDGRNLLLTQSNGKTKTAFTYYPETNLIHSCITSGKESFGNHELQLRKFYEYDDNGVVSKEIIDDGTTNDVQSLTGVTQRHIKYIQNTITAPIGLPEIIEDKYLDLATQQERLLKKTIQHYSIQGRLFQQDLYDADDCYSCSSYWEYNAMGLITKEVNTLGDTIHREYDLNSNLTKEIGPFPGQEKRYTYDFSNRLIRVDETHSDGSSFSTGYRYDFCGNQVASVDRYGNETLYEYDACHRPVKMIYPPTAQGEILTTQTEYDLFDHPTIEVDTAGFITQTAYTIQGKPYWKQYSDGTEERWEYEPDGTLIHSWGCDKLKRTYFYDSFKRITAEEVYSPQGELLKRTSKTYNSFHLLSETTSSGLETHYQYDAAGRLIKQQQGDRETLYQYDSMGRVEKTITCYDTETKASIIKAQSYDLLNRVTEERTEDFLGNILIRTTYEYDVQNHKIAMHSFIGAGELIRREIYNSQGEILLTINPEGNQTRSYSINGTRNSLGQLVACHEIVDPMGRITTQTFDALGRLTETIKRDSFGQRLHAQYLDYDAQSNVCRQIEEVHAASGIRTIENRWTYDSMKRVVDMYESVSAIEKHTHFTYNAYGQKDTVIKPDGTQLTYRYDSLGRLADYSASDHSFHYTYTYDLDDHPIEVYDETLERKTTKSYNIYGNVLSESLGNGLQVEYEYDLMGRPTRVIYPDGSNAVYTYSASFLTAITRYDASGHEQYRHEYTSYDQAGNLLATDLVGNAGKIDYIFDSAGRKSGIDGGVWASFINRYDAAGNILQKTTKDPIGKTVQDYTYDALYHLKSESGDIAHDYTYDSIHNRLSKDGHRYTVNELSQITSDGINSYAYDANGNLIQKRTPTLITDFTYDALDRLISVNIDGSQIDYSYDEENRRLSKTKNDEETHYLYQGQNEVGSYDSHGEAIELRILGIGQGAEIGATIAIELGEKVYVPIHDLHGNMAALIDAHSGEVQEFYRLSAFGEALIYDGNGNELATSINPWQFSCKRFDAETKFIYFGRRYYNTSLGRWITADPLGLKEGPNLYAYVNNAPLTHIDLYGLYARPTIRDDHPSSRFLPQRHLWRSPHTYRKKMSNHSLSAAFDKRKKKWHHQGSRIVFNNHAANKKYARENTTSYTIPGWTKEDLGVMVTNGVFNDSDMAIDTGEMISELGGGCEVTLIHNDHGGKIYDIARYINSRNYIASRAVLELHKQWDHFFDNHSDKARILQIASSEGCVNVRNALMSYDPERGRRIIFLALAPGSFTNPKYCERVMHYTSRRDFVYLLDPAGLQRHRDTLTILEPHRDAPLFDHGIDSPTFTETIKDTLTDFFKGSK